MLEVLIAIGVVVLLGGAFYLRRTMPWPFTHNGRKYRRLSDGTFQDAEKRRVTDQTLLPHLVAAYEAAKYGTGELKAWDADT